MPRSARNWAYGSTWRELLLTIVGTTISIVLTFGTAGLLDRCQRIEDRKMSAMMVMSNIEKFSRTAKEMSQKIARCDSIGAWMLSLPKDSLDLIPPEEVQNLLLEVMTLVDPLTHDKTAENIFSNSIETWKNMGNFQFIDNVGKCFSEMNANEANWNQWVNEYEATISDVVSQMKPGEHSFTKLLNDNSFRQKLVDFHVRKAWLEYVAANIRYLNSMNSQLIGIDEDEVMAFTDERSRDILISKEKPKQADFRTDTISFDSLTTLRPVIQHFDSIMQGKIPAKKRKK
jgi:hypothetical protein